MSILNDLFGPGRDDKEDARLYAQQLAKLNAEAARWSMMQNQAMNTVNMGVQNMAGGAPGVAIGAVQGQYANSYQPWGNHLSSAQVRDKTRDHIASEVEKMAEEIGAPTLLHAVVLAIRTMEIPE